MSTATQPLPKPIEILLVEDDDGDVLLTRKALAKGKIYNSLSVVQDGIEALAFLRKEGEYADAPRPDLILLDLNMPRMDGKETLAHIKKDKNIRSIPVVVLTTSDAVHDVFESYDLQASCYISKPIDLGQFMNVVHEIKNFWFSVVTLPQQ